VKFIQTYETEGIPIHAVTIQNEPGVDRLTQAPRWHYPSCRYTGEQERDFIRDHLGPAFRRAGTKSERPALSARATSHWLHLDSKAFEKLACAFSCGEILFAPLDEPSLLYAPSQETATDSERIDPSHARCCSTSLLIEREVGPMPLLVLLLRDTELAY